MKIMPPSSALECHHENLKSVTFTGDVHPFGDNSTNMT
jgi:hypothetical protein